MFVKKNQKKKRWKQTVHRRRIAAVSLLCALLLGGNTAAECAGVVSKGIVTDCLELEETITVQEYQTILRHPESWLIRFRFLTWLNDLLC